MPLLARPNAKLTRPDPRSPSDLRRTLVGRDRVQRLLGRPPGKRAGRWQLGLPIVDYEFPPPLSAQVRDCLKPIFENAAIEKIGQNLKYDTLVLRGVGIELRGIAFDTMVADYLLEPGERSHNMDDMARRHLCHHTITIDELIGKGKNQKRMDEVPVATITQPIDGVNVDVPGDIPKIDIAGTVTGEGLLSHVTATVAFRRPPESATLPPLTTHDPPVWLRHLHWLLVLFLIPLAFSLLQKGDDEDVVRRLIETIDEAPPDAHARAIQALEEMDKGHGSFDQVLEALPDQKLRGAYLPRDF